LQHYEGDGDPHDQIVRLEAHIEELAAKIESCRKFILASRIVVAGGGIVLAAKFLDAIRFDPAAMTAAIAALLGRHCCVGFQRRTAKEAEKELAVAETDRTALIDVINPRAIPPKVSAAPGDARPQGEGLELRD
jgi:hypothetical protein